MITGTQKLGCGGCGNETAELYRHEESNRILIECTKCGSVSEIRTYEPRIQVDWARDHQSSTGCFAPVPGGGS